MLNNFVGKDPKNEDINNVSATTVEVYVSICLWLRLRVKQWRHRNVIHFTPSDVKHFFPDLSKVLFHENDFSIFTLGGEKFLRKGR